MNNDTEDTELKLIKELDDLFPFEVEISADWGTHWPRLINFIQAREREAEEEVAYTIVSTITEGIIDNGDVFIKQKPLNQTMINIVGYEKFKAMQEAVADLKKEKS